MSAAGIGVIGPRGSKYEGADERGRRAGGKLTKSTTNEIQLGKVKHSDVISANNGTVEGKRQSVDEFVGLLDTFPFWFNIVTP